MKQLLVELLIGKGWTKITNWLFDLTSESCYGAFVNPFSIDL